MITSTVKGAVQQKTSSTIADKDSYVDDATPERNRGIFNYLKAGYGLPIFETYIHFNLTNKPSNITKAELVLYIFDIDVTSNLTLGLVEENWDEMTITWNNKPLHGQTILKFTVSTDDWYRIDLTSLLTTRTTISLCIYMMPIDLMLHDEVYISSKNNYINKPRIDWTYEVTVPDEIPVPVPGYNVFIIIGIIAVVVSFFLVRKRNVI